MRGIIISLPGITEVRTYLVSVCARVSWVVSQVSSACSHGASACRGAQERRAGTRAPASREQENPSPRGSDCVGRSARSRRLPAVATARTQQSAMCSTSSGKPEAPELARTRGPAKSVQATEPVTRGWTSKRRGLKREWRGAALSGPPKGQHR